MSQTDSTDATTQESVTPAADTPQSPDGSPPQSQETPAQRKFRLQRGEHVEEVDGTALLDELLADWGEDKIVETTQISREARRRMSEAAKLRKELEQAAQDLKDPRRAFALLEKQWGGRENLRQILDDYYAADLEDRLMPEDKRKMRDLEAELARYRKLEAEQKKREQAEKRSYELQQAQQKIGRAFQEALANAGIEANPLNLARMATLAEADLAELGTFDPMELAKEVAREVQSYKTDGLKKLASNPEQLVAMLGDDGVRALNKYLVERAQAKLPTVAPVAPAKRERTQTEERQPTRLEDWYASKRQK